MQTFYGAAKQLPQTEIYGLHAYRYNVFVERLHWNLPGARNGLEVDEFDREDTIYILGRDKKGVLCGCARLLPTTKPYLLSEIFPELMHGISLPRSDDVWEISRF